MDSDPKDPIDQIDKNSDWIISIFEIISDMPPVGLLILGAIVIYAIKEITNAYVRSKKYHLHLDEDDDVKSNDKNDDKGNTATIPIETFMNMITTREKEVEKISKELENINKIDSMQAEIEKIGKIQEEINILKEDISNIKGELERLKGNL